MNSREALTPSSDARPVRNLSGKSCRYVVFGSFQLDLQRHELFKDGKRLSLQGKVAEALLVLLEKPGEVVTREALRLRLWPGAAQVNYDANVNTTINKLRRLLGGSPDQPPFIETIPRQGYAFVGKLRYLDQPPADNPEQTIKDKNRLDWGTASDSEKFSANAVPAPTWFIAGMISLLVSEILLGAAILLYRHRMW